MRADYRYLRMALALVILLSALVHSSALAGPILLDTTFDTDGKVTTGFGTENDVARAVAIQPDGKIVAAGYYRSGDDFDFAVARYNSDGSRDTTFGASGRRSADFFGFFDFAHAVAVQPDGKIVVAGFTSNGSNNDFALVRFTSTGSPDTAFSTDGKVTTDFGGFFGTEDLANAVAIQPDGKIVVVGQSSQGGANYDFAVARYNSDGSPDNTFDGDGELITGFQTLSDEIGYAVALQPDGRIVVAGSTATTGNLDFALLRINSNGSPDPTFNGIVTTDFFAGSSDEAYAVALQPDGKIVLAGTSGPGWSDFALARYNSDGSPDTNFAGQGKTTTDFNRSLDIGRAVAIQPDGKIIVAGSSQASFGGFPVDFALARYTGNGWNDAIFDGDGRLTTSIGTDDYGYAVALQPDGKIVVAGPSNNGSNTDFALARYLGDTATFVDVPIDYWAWQFVELLYSDGITGGCATNPLAYCPEASVTRAQMAVFLERGLGTQPPPATGTRFADVPASHWAAAWIEKFAADGITTGCGGGNYCPEQSVTRAQMAVFLLRTKYGVGYAPPAVGSGTGFGDVPPDYWAAAWIKQLVTEGITAGCGNGNYCPEQPVTRAQMAVFLVRIFGLLGF